MLWVCQTGVQYPIVQTNQFLLTCSGTGRTCLFSPLESLSDLSRQSSQSIWTPVPMAWVPIWGFPDFGNLDPFRPQAPYQLFGTKVVIFWTPSLGSIATGHQVMIATDNTTVLSYFNKQGGTHFHTLLRLAVDLFLWLHIAIRARHISGCLNVIADCLSGSNQPITTEWSLHPEILSRIFRTWGTPTVDMFATVHNTNLHNFYVSDSGASITGDRSPVTGLAGEVDVHVSTVPPAQQSHSET